MIPILKERVYEINAISFKTVGFLADAHNCQVAEERNGIFELSFSYPVESLMFQYLREDLLVLAKPNDTDNDQMFRIYEIAKPINGVVTVKCEHISYELRNYPIKNTALHSITPHTMIQGLIDLAKNNVSGQNSNINLYHAQSSGRTVTSSLDLPLATVRSALGGIDGSVLDIFGGEYKFDNFDIFLPESRGSDNGVIVAYRKNLTDVKLTTSMESSYTGLFPYTLKDDVYTFLSSTQYPAGSIPVTNTSGIAERILMRDFSSEFEDGEEITSAALLTKAQAFLNKNDINALTASMSVSFVNLWQSEEYKDYAPLEKVGLCDIVTVYHEKLGINLKLKVIKTVYDPISERYIKIELGSPKSDFAATIAQQQKQVNEAVKIARSTGYSQITAEYQQAIADATAKITGNSGGNVRFTLNAVGKPEEITVMDTGDTSTATKCWRWNLSGFGYSSTGYSGTYETAITAGGEINANFITTGTMTAERVRTGLLSSADARTYFDLTTSEICTIGSSDSNNFKTYFRGGDIEFYGSTSGGEMGKTAKMRTGYQTSGSTTTKHFAIGYISNDNSSETDGSSSLKLGAFATSDDHFIDLLELSGSSGAVFGTSSNKISAYIQGGHVETNSLNMNGEAVNAFGKFSTGVLHRSAHKLDSINGTALLSYRSGDGSTKSFSFNSGGNYVEKIEKKLDGGSYEIVSSDSYTVNATNHTVTFTNAPENNSIIKITVWQRGYRKNYFGAYVDANGNHWTGWQAYDSSDNFLHSFTGLKLSDNSVGLRFAVSSYSAYFFVDCNNGGVYFRNSPDGNWNASTKGLNLYCKNVLADEVYINNGVNNIANLINAKADSSTVSDLNTTVSSHTSSISSYADQLSGNGWLAKRDRELRSNIQALSNCIRSLHSGASTGVSWTSSLWADVT